MSYLNFGRFFLAFSTDPALVASLFNTRWRTQYDVLSRFLDTLWYIPTSGLSASLENLCDRLDFDAGDKVSLHD